MKFAKRADALAALKTTRREIRDENQRWRVLRAEFRAQVEAVRAACKEQRAALQTRGGAERLDLRGAIGARRAELRGGAKSTIAKLRELVGAPPSAVTDLKAFERNAKIIDQSLAAVEKAAERAVASADPAAVERLESLVATGDASDARLADEVKGAALTVIAQYEGDQAPAAGRKRSGLVKLSPSTSTTPAPSAAEVENFRRLARQHFATQAASAPEAPPSAAEVENFRQLARQHFAKQAPAAPKGRGVGRRDYDERRAARIARLEERAAKKAQAAEGHHRRADAVARRFEAGQPIILGHHSTQRALRDRERMDTSMRASIREREAAQELQRRAESAEANVAISSDNPRAVEALREKLAAMKERLELTKQVRKIVRTTKTPATRAAALAPLNLNPRDELIRAAMSDAFRGAFPDKLPEYLATNLAANIRRVEERLQGLEKLATVEELPDEEIGDTTLEEADNRLKLHFAGKPSDKTIELLKSHGFNWSRGESAWMRKITPENRENVIRIGRFIAHQEAGTTPEPEAPKPAPVPVNVEADEQDALGEGLREAGANPAVARAVSRYVHAIQSRLLQPDDLQISYSGGQRNPNIEISYANEVGPDKWRGRFPLAIIKKATGAVYSVDSHNKPRELITTLADPAQTFWPADEYPRVIPVYLLHRDSLLQWLEEALPSVYPRITVPARSLYTAWMRAAGEPDILRTDYADEFAKFLAQQHEVLFHESDAAPLHEADRAALRRTLDTTKQAFSQSFGVLVAGKKKHLNVGMEFPERIELRKLAAVARALLPSLPFQQRADLEAAIPDEARIENKHMTPADLREFVADLRGAMALASLTPQNLERWYEAGLPARKPLLSVPLAVLAETWAAEAQVPLTAERIAAFKSFVQRGHQNRVLYVEPELRLVDMSPLERKLSWEYGPGQHAFALGLVRDHQPSRSVALGEASLRRFSDAKEQSRREGFRAAALKQFQKPAETKPAETKPERKRLSSFVTERGVTFRLNDTVYLGKDDKRFVIARILEAPVDGKPEIVFYATPLSGEPSGLKYLVRSVGSSLHRLRFPSPVWYGKQAKARYEQYQKFFADGPEDVPMAPFTSAPSKPDEPALTREERESASTAPNAESADVVIRHRTATGTVATWDNEADRARPRDKSIYHTLRRFGFVWVPSEKVYRRTNSVGLVESRIPEASIASLLSPLTVWFDLEEGSTEEAIERRREYLETRAERIAERAEQRAEKAEQMLHGAERRAEQELTRSEIEGYYPTPPEIVEYIMATGDVEPGQVVLEPSAGHGALAEALRSAGAEVEVIEINPKLREELKKRRFPVVATDALDASFAPGARYERIVMNPPFEDGQSLTHTRRAWELLAPGGRLVAVLPASVESRTDRRHEDFRAWAAKHGGAFYPLPLAQFGRAKVNTVLLLLQKPADAESPPLDEATLARIEAAHAEVESRPALKVESHARERMRDLNERQRQHNAGRRVEPLSRAERAELKALELAYSAERAAEKAQRIARSAKLVTEEDVSREGNRTERKGPRVAAVDERFDDVIKGLRKYARENKAKFELGYRASASRDGRAMVTFQITFTGQRYQVTLYFDGATYEWTVAAGFMRPPFARADGVTTPAQVVREVKSAIDDARKWTTNRDEILQRHEARVKDESESRQREREAVSPAVSRNPPLTGFDLFEDVKEAPSSPVALFERVASGTAASYPAHLYLRLQKLPPRLSRLDRVYIAQVPTGQGYSLAWFVDVPEQPTMTLARALRNALIPRRDLPSSEYALHQAPLYLHDPATGEFVRFDPQSESRQREVNKPAEEPKVIQALGYQVADDKGKLQVQRQSIDVTRQGDYGADPVGDGTFRMVPSGDVVTWDERNRRLGAPVDLSAMVSTLIKQLADDGGQVRLADLRAAFSATPWEDVSRVVLSLAKDGQIHLYREDNNAALTQRDRDAAVLVGGEPRHLVLLANGNTLQRLKEKAEARKTQFRASALSHFAKLPKAAPGTETPAEILKRIGWNAAGHPAELRDEDGRMVLVQGPSGKPRAVEDVFPEGLQIDWHWGTGVVEHNPSDPTQVRMREMDGNKLSSRLTEYKGAAALLNDVMFHVGQQEREQKQRESLQRQKAIKEQKEMLARVEKNMDNDFTLAHFWKGKADPTDIMQFAGTMMVPPIESAFKRWEKIIEERWSGPYQGRLRARLSNNYRELRAELARGVSLGLRNNLESRFISQAEADRLARYINENLRAIPSSDDWEYLRRVYSEALSKIERADAAYYGGIGAQNVHDQYKAILGEAERFVANVERESKDPEPRAMLLTEEVQAREVDRAKTLEASLRKLPPPPTHKDAFLAKSEDLEQDRSKMLDRLSRVPALMKAAAELQQRAFAEKKRKEEAEREERRAEQERRTEAAIQTIAATPEEKGKIAITMRDGEVRNVTGKRLNEYVAVTRMIMASGDESDRPNGWALTDLTTGLNLLSGLKQSEAKAAAKRAESLFGPQYKAITVKIAKNEKLTSEENELVRKLQDAIRGS